MSKSGFKKIDDLLSRSAAANRNAPAVSRPAAELVNRSEGYKEIDARLSAGARHDTDEVLYPDIDQWMRDRDELLTMQRKNQSVLERIGGTAVGAAKDFIGSKASTWGNIAEGLSRLGERLGGNTSDYAGWATDELSAGQIGMENDLEKRRQQMQEAKDMQDWGYRQIESGARDMEKAQAGVGRLGRIGLGMEASMIGMAGDALENFFMPGASLLSLGTRAAGGGMHEADKAGASYGRKMTYGLGAGGLEAGSEMLFGGLSKIYGRGIVDNFGERIIRRMVSSDAGRKVLLALGDMGEEAVEEAIVDLVDPLIKTVYNGKSVGESYRENFDAGQMLEDALVGGLMGAFGAGTKAIGTKARPSDYSQTVRKMGYADTAEQQLLEKGWNKKDSSNYSELIAKQVAGESLNAKQQAMMDSRPTALEIAGEIGKGETVRAAKEEHAQTGEQFVRQIISNLGVSEQDAQILAGGLNIADTDPQAYGLGIQEAFKLGQLGLTYEQARENAVFVDKLTEPQFRHAFEIGAMQSSNTASAEEAEPQRPINRKDYGSVEEFSQEFEQPERVREIFDSVPETDLGAFTQEFQTAYDMGQSGVSANYLTEANIPTLTPEQARAAFDMGREAAAAGAEEVAETFGAQQRQGNLQRVRGTVKGEGVSIADLKKTFNDSQNTAYRLLTRFADVTGVNIVLYNSQADPKTGVFQGSNGMFKWKNDTIYIDINSGLYKTKDVNSLGKYTMLRTFNHEFTHFIEKWNPKEYNVFREFIFSAMESQGNNVHDMIEKEMLADSSGEMTYDDASREVVAESMVDVLQDSTLVQQLAEENPNLFRTILRKLKQFVARIKQYYRGLTTKSPEAEALKENGAYLDGIVRMWDSIAKGAVENYQRATAEELYDQPAKPENLPSLTQEKSKSNPSPETRRAGMDFFRNVDVKEEQAPDLRSMVQRPAPETRRAGMDFFRTGEYGETEEEAPNLRGMVQRAPSQPETQPVGRDRFPVNDFTSQAEEAPKLRERATQVRPVSRDRFPANDLTSRAEQGEDLRGMVKRAPVQEEAEEPTVAEVIEQEAPAEPVPPKAETEKAEENLKKKGISVPVEKSNKDAIELGLTTGQLSTDNIVLTGEVHGLNAAQRAHIIDSLLKAYYAGKTEVRIDVPYDGKFVLPTKFESVVDYLLKLRAKALQDVIFTKKLDNYLKKAGRVVVYHFGEQRFISTGKELIPITKEAEKHAVDEYKASVNNLNNNARKLIDGDYTAITEAPVEVTFESGDKVYRFQAGDQTIHIDKALFDFFDGGRVFGTAYKLGEKDMTAVKVTSPDGTPVGYLLGTSVKTNQKEKSVLPSKLKSFSKKAMQEMEKEKTPSKKKQDKADRPQEKKNETKQEEKQKSRFPLQAWKNGTPSQKAAYRILTEHLHLGKGLPSKTLYEICDEAFGGTQSEGRYNRKDAYDAMELAVNQYLLNVMQAYNEGDVKNALLGVKTAQSILNLLPTQSVRTQEQEDFQQFSTPPSIAYLAAWAANINNQDHVLEPSAGIGGLLSFAKAWGAETTANELSERRYAIIRSMGFDHYFNENAEHINNVLPDEIQPTVVIMNPPFSSTAGRTKSNKTSNAELHINSALDRLAEGGRLVAIVGRGMADDKYSKYWNKVRQEYTIRANIGVDGKNYAKYGTSFDVQIVVIDKVGPQGSVKTLTGQFADLSQIPAKLEGIRNDRSTEVKRDTRITGNQEAAAAERGEEQTVSPAMAETDSADGGRASPGNRTDGRRGSESGISDVQKPGRVEESVQSTDTVERGTMEQQRADQEDQRSGKAVERSEADEESGRPAGRTGIASDVQGESEQQYRGPESEPARNGQVAADPVTDDGVYTGYRSPAIPVKGAQGHPAVLVESAAMGAVGMPKATYTPSLPDRITKTGVLSDAQLVSVVYAGQAHEQKLPSGERRGFFIGDGTGVGKGRQIVGIILDNFNQGRKKAIWISEKQSLFNDAQRDWVDVAGRNKDEVHSLSKVKVDDKIDFSDGIVYTTYDTIRSGSKTKSRVEQLAEWFGKDYDGVIVFDEAHNMGNLLGRKGKFGKSKGSAKAIAAVELQKLLPNARVVYASATAATEVDGLAFASRLGLWGPGTAFSDVNDFVSKIGSSGLSAMELVIRDMKAMGMYVARSISYNGVEYRTIQHNLDPMQTQIYNTMSRAWQNTMRSVEQSLADTGAQYNAKAKSLAIGQYYSAIQRFYNQVLTSMSMPSVIADMREQLANGKSCVLQVVNTNQAEADRQMASIKAEGGELDDMDLTPRGTLVEYLMQYYPVTLYEEYTDDNGNTQSRPVLNSKGEPVLDKKAVAKRDALIEEINQMSIPDGPLEMLFDAFGTENVSEITGRTRRVVPRKQADGSIKRVEESRSEKSKEADVNAFQDGKKRILIFNDAGGTGKSYHADNRAKNKQQRVHYVVQPGWQASKAVQGFGRTHRSNEASAPIYKLVTTNIKGQKRFTSTIARRLDQLGALTKGQRDTGSGMFGASDNLETDLAKDALREFYRRLGMNKLEGINGQQVLKKLGLLEKFTGDYGEFKLNDTVARDISKFLNRILALEVDEQNQVFDAFISIYEMEMEAAIAAGTLDRGMENVKADKIEIVDDKVINEQKGTGAATHYVQAKVYTKPKVITTVSEAENLRGGFQGIYRTKDGDVRAVYRIADKTTDYGAVVKQFKVQSPNRSKSNVWQERTLEANAEALPKSEWQKAWEEELKKVPEYNEEIKHMLTGSLLPIWNTLPEEGNTKVQRLITDDGKAYLGRIIAGDQIDNVLRRFDVNRTKEKYTGKSLMKKALNSPSIFQLTYERAKIHRSKVSGEWRLEYEQPHNAFYITQRYPGIIQEKINWQTRFFIPTGEAGEAILDKILENNPVSNVVDRNDDTVQYSRRARTEEVQDDAGGQGEGRVQFSRRVTNPETLKMLNDQVEKGEVIHTYKTFLELEVNGEKKLYPPMASKQKDDGGKYKMANAIALNEWEESVGNPNSQNIVKEVDKDGNVKWYYNLKKDDGSVVKAAYDPYQHSSDVVLNDQFDTAYKRPNLVTYECIIPQSEMTSGYWYREARADGDIVEAALPVGEHEWKKGPVADKLTNTDRKVYMTRWIMPVRRLDDAEVAQQYKEILDREDGDVSVPFNVVTPSLRAELEKISVPIDYEGSPIYRSLRDRYGSEKYPVGKPIVRNSMRRESLTDREILERAAQGMETESLTDGEKNALSIFNNALEKLKAEQEHRQELGRQYKDQQFTRGGSRTEADKIRAAMSVSDSKIRSLENRLLSMENKEMLKRVLQKARTVVEAEERKHGDEKLRRYRERRNESDATRKYRERVFKEVETLRKWMMTPSNKDVRAHVPAEIQKTVVDLLDSINLMSKTALRTGGVETTKADEKYLKNMKRLRDAIKHNVDSKGLYSGYNDLPDGFIDQFDAMISGAENYIRANNGSFIVNAMTASELKSLSDMLKTLRKYIVTMNQFHNNAMFEHAYEAGEETIQHLAPFAKSKKSGTAYKFMRFDYMRPSYAFTHFGRGGESIEHEFREGQATQAFLAKKIIAFAESTYSGKEVKAWSEETKTFTTSDGETVTMPVADLMSLYCLNKRPQALTHLYGDGIRVANYKDGRNVQIDEGHVVSIGDVQRMIGTLTQRQKDVADALQKYMSTVGSEMGNYVSMRRFGVEQFTEPNYFPINSDGRYISTTADESPDNAGLYALLNSSFTKEIKENADNRIILYNIFDVFANHMASMTQYRSFALPVLDALKWFNYKNDTTSVRTKLSSAFGAPLDERAGSGAKGYAEQFVINLLKAYNGTAAQGDPYDSKMLRWLHRYNGAAIAFNLRVIIQQPTAIARAAMILSPARLAKGLGMSVIQLRSLANEMEAHSGIAAWKSLGFYDTNISRGLTELIKQNPTALDKIMEKGTAGAEAADRLTWAAMWHAAKETVRRSNYASEEEYFKAVTDLFEDVIYKTQVVDSLLTKAEFLRSKGALARQLGSFMSEPSATMSMLADAHFKYTDDLQRGMSRSEAWKKNGGNIAKTAAVYAVGQVILAAMQAVIDAWRDNDDKDPEDWLNNYLLKYVDAFKGNVIEELLPFGKIPVVSEIYEQLKSWLDYAGVFDKIGLDLYGNDISSGLTMYLKYVNKAMQTIIDKAVGNKTNYTDYSIIYNLMRGVSNLTGIPVATAWREVQDVWNNTVGFFAPSYKLKTYESAKERKAREGFAAYVQATGLSQGEYKAIFDAADPDGDGIEQGELGPILQEKLQKGELNRQQADAIWAVQEWKTDFQKWNEKNGGQKAAEKTSDKKTESTQAVPKTEAKKTEASTKTAGNSIPIYGPKREATLAAKPAGMSEERYAEILRAADIDGNDSLKQDELGAALKRSVERREMSHEEAARVWASQGWSANHSYEWWLSRH